MPSVKDSSVMDRSQLTPASPPALMPVGSIVPDASLQMSPFFHASLPATTATYDLLSRQYYRNSRIPQTRLLPAGKTT
jgi:hypothetical protein